MNMSIPSQKQIFPALVLIGVGILIGIVGFTLIAAGEIYDYQDSVDGAHFPEVDAIVCLAGGRGRISEAGDLWFRYWEASQATGAKLPIFYVSGMGAKADWGVLGRQLRKGVLATLKSENVILENESQNTDENAQWVGQFATEKKWKRILLITSRYHMRRAANIFERTFAKAKIPTEIQTLSVYQEPFEPG